MSRRARELSPTGIYHVMMRGVNRQRIFRNDTDRVKLIETFARYSEIGCYRIYAYCLMDNHIHLLIKEHNDPISTGIKRVSSSYVYWYNEKYERCGHLFQERFKSEVVDNDRYFLTVLRYIHQNPVKAKIVKDPSDYKWSSYGEYIGRDRIIDKDYVLKMFSSSAINAVKEFESFMKVNNDDQCLDMEETNSLKDELLKQIIAEEFEVDNTKVLELGKSSQEEIIKRLKEIDGVSIRQIARITGISQTKVWRI